MVAKSSTSAMALDRAYRFVSKVPAFDISSSDPVDTATGVAINKTISITFSMPLNPPSVTDANITITPSVTRTTALDAVNHKIVTIDPTSNLAASTLYTITMTSNLRGLYGLWTVQPPTTDSISFTTV
jgi:methionine-rich copper-binding protein CopC